MGEDDALLVSVGLHTPNDAAGQVASKALAERRLALMMKPAVAGPHCFAGVDDSSGSDGDG